MMTSAIARCLEDILNKQIPNLFRLEFKTNLSFGEAIDKWASIVNAASAYTKPLVEGLADGFKTRGTVEEAILQFQSDIVATREPLTTIYTEFAEQVT